MYAAIENFQRLTHEFQDAIALFTDRERNLAPEGEWSAAYIVHHVSDCELHFAARYLFILGSDNPAMPFFDEERYPAALNYESRSVVKSLASISGVRTMILDILSEISPESWKRSTTAEDGTVYTLEQLVNKAEDHLIAHTQQLLSLRKKI